METVPDHFRTVFCSYLSCLSLIEPQSAPIHILKRFTAILILLIAIVFTIDAQDNRYEHYFRALDSVIAHQNTYKKGQEAQIADLRQQNANAHDDAEHYLINSLIIEKYRYYICDSALAYLDQNEILAKRMNSQDHLNEIYLEKCDLFIRTGMTSNAQDIFDKINVESFPDVTKARYYALKIFLLVQNSSTPVSIMMDNPDVSRNAKELARFAKEGDMSSVWSAMWNYRGADRNEKLIPIIQKQYENDLKNGNIAAGDMAFMIARSYSLMHKEDLWIKYLCAGAAYNVIHMKLDPTALLDLVSWLSEHGDSQRAYKYLDYVLQCQAYYPDRIRSTQMAQYMKRIFEQTQKTNGKARQKANLYLWGLTAAFTLSLVFLFIVAFSLVKLKRHRKNLAEVNKKLGDNIAQLSEAKEALVATTAKIEETNRELAQANFIKEEYIGYGFTICAEYIDKMQSLRQTINRKLMVGQTEEVIRMTRSEGDIINREVKELNRKLDTIFLSIYPDFVNDFNELLRPEERYSLRQDEGLNTDLRIFALVWLGIDNSGKIANLLHLSTQTVYNARMKMRNKAMNDPESFADRVKTIGRGKLGV